MKRLPGFIIMLIFLAGNVVFFIPKISRSMNKLNKLEEHIEELDVKIVGYSKEINLYEEKISKMKNEFYREKMGRDKHKLIKDGEIIYRPANQ
ncbi:MAG: septum formation initiator family protein [Fusobacteriaceae bacterium]